MKRRGREPRGTLARWGALGGALWMAAGCGGGGGWAHGAASASGSAPAPTGRPVEAKGRSAESEEQHAAQVAWCDYLQALYLRAAQGSQAWPRYQQCTEAVSTASPAMLRRTAECSHRALQSFPGDPFTEEYAAEVSRCGSEAVESVVIGAGELAPFLAAICGRVSACGILEYGECRDTLQVGLGAHLERAIGALNTRARDELKACLSNSPCDEVGSQITGCLEPIMDQLLWLPDDQAG